MAKYTITRYEGNDNEGYETKGWFSAETPDEIKKMTHDDSNKFKYIIENHQESRISYTDKNLNFIRKF